MARASASRSTAGRWLARWPARPRDGDASAERLARYEKQWRARYGREMDISYIVNQRIAAWSDAQWDDSMDLLRRLTPAQAADLLQVSMPAAE